MLMSDHFDGAWNEDCSDSQKGIRNQEERKENKKGGWGERKEREGEKELNSDSKTPPHIPLQIVLQVSE